MRKVKERALGIVADGNGKEREGCRCHEHGKLLYMMGAKKKKCGIRKGILVIRDFTK